MIKVKKYPFIKQNGLKDCAAACLFMIIRYYKGYISMDKLEEMLKITRNGTTAYHIIEALKEIGFNARGIKLKKLKQTTIPFIANVIINRSYKHYIVVYKVTDKYIKIADPASKIKNITFEEFYNMWTGVNIEMYPIKLITNEKPKNIRKVIKLINIKKIEIFKIGLLSIVVTIFSIVGSFFFQILIDNMNKNINNVIFFFLSLFFLRTVITYIRTKYLIKLTNNIDKKITKSIFYNILSLPYRYYYNHTTGEIISKINDIAILRDITGKIILTIFIDFPLTIFSGLLLYKINKTLSLIVLIILILYLFIIFIYHKKINQQINKTLEEKADINSFMTEALSGFETIKGLNIENKIFNIFNAKYNKYNKSMYKLDSAVNRQKTIKDFIEIFGNAIILIIGITLVKNQTILLSTLITYNILVAFFLEPVKNIISLDFEIKEAFNSINRALEFDINNKKKTNKKLKGDINVQNLKFTLTDDKYILNNINLVIKENSKVLITGQSGGGKSTFLKILKGYYQDYEGQILIDNQKQTNTENIIYISEKNTIFTGTIHYNLTFKSNDINKNIKICQLNDIIKEANLGINTLLEENGFNISNGQKQRIALARSLYDFDILLIDEALNGLDTNLERKILKQLFQVYKNKTIIIVSHRLDNLDLFSHYIKLEKGKVVIDATLPRKEIV